VSCHRDKVTGQRLQLVAKKPLSNAMAELPGLPVHHRYGPSARWTLLCAIAVVQIAAL
jgi:hypothetical protein